MNLTNVDNELNLKIFEVFKLILKEENTTIVFDLPSDNIEEITFVSNKEHAFKLYKHKDECSSNELNYFYYKLLPKKIKLKYTNLTNKELIEIASNKKSFNFYKMFFGKIIIEKKYYIQYYKINYNNVVINLEKETYDKLLFYTKNVFKLQQLSKLNNKLNIEQKFSIVFEEETIKNELYDTFYNTFKDIIKPPDKDFL